MSGTLNCKGLATRMKECSPLGIHVHCNGHRLNLALQDAMTAIEPLWNALGTMQRLYNFIEGSPKRHTIFKDMEVESEEHVVLTIKSLSVTRWSCSWAAVKAVVEQMPKIIQALLKLSKDRDPKPTMSAMHYFAQFVTFDLFSVWWC